MAETAYAWVLIIKKDSMYSFSVIHESRNLKQARPLCGQDVDLLRNLYACYSPTGTRIFLTVSQSGANINTSEKILWGLSLQTIFYNIHLCHALCQECDSLCLIFRVKGHCHHIFPTIYKDFRTVTVKNHTQF